MEQSSSSTSGLGDAASESGPGQCSKSSAETASGLSANVPIASNYQFVNYSNAIEAQWDNRKVVIATANGRAGEFMVYLEREKPDDYSPENDAGFEVVGDRLVKRFYLSGAALCAVSDMVDMLRSGAVVIRVRDAEGTTEGSGSSDQREENGTPQQPGPTKEGDAQNIPNPKD